MELKYRLLSESLKMNITKIYDSLKEENPLHIALLTLLNNNSLVEYSEMSIRNLTINSKQELTYCPKGKETVMSVTQVNKWTTKNRQSGKYGKVFRKVFKQLNIDSLKDSDIETFVNLLKSSNADTSDTFRVITGQEIAEVYSNPNLDEDINTGSLSGSCMNEKPESFFDIYVDNAEMLILENTDGVLLGRAILWEADGGQKLMDRIYASDANINRFKNWAKDNGYWHKEYQNYNDKEDWVNCEGDCICKTFSISVSKEYDQYPYMDTFQYTSDLDSYITNDCCDSDYQFDETDGTYVGSNRVWDEINDCYIDEDEARFMNYRGEYTHEDNVYYSDYDSDYIYEHDVVETIQGNIYSNESYGYVTLNNGDYCDEHDAFYCEQSEEYYQWHDVVDLYDFTDGEHNGYVAKDILDDWCSENDFNQDEDEEEE